MLSVDVFRLLQDIADLRKALSEANRTEELYRSQSREQIRGLLATAAELQQRLLSLEKDKKSVSVGGVAEKLRTSEISLCGCRSNRFMDRILHPAMLFPHYLCAQVNDTTVGLPGSSESGAAEREDDGATSKPPPDEAEGAVETAARGANHACEFHSNVLSLSLSCIPTVVSTAAAESQSSRLPRFSPQSRFKLSTQKACPEKILLPGVRSLKGAFLSLPFLFFYFKYLLNILRRRSLFSGDIMQYILSPLVARQP